MAIELRKFPRSSLNEETLYFLHAGKGSSAERIYSPATITNISKGGIGMQVGIPHKIDDELWLEGIEGFTGIQSAHVKWIISSRDKETFSIGVKFEESRN